MKAVATICWDQWFVSRIRHFH